MHKGRQVDKWGEPFTGICDFVVQNGVISIEGLISTNFTSKDKESLEEFVRQEGYDFYESCHMVNGKRIKTTKQKIKAKKKRKPNKKPMKKTGY